MIAVIIQLKKHLDAAVRSADSVGRDLPWPAAFFFFLGVQFGSAPIRAVRLVVSIPIHARLSTQRAFEATARRGASGEFLDSYSDLIRQQRMAVLSIVVALVFVGLQLSVLGFGLYEAGKPTPAFAYSTSVDLNPTWDNWFSRSVWYNDNFSGGCDVYETYMCADPSTVALSYGRQGNPPGSCTGIFDLEVIYNRAALKFSLASIPDDATVTNVELIANVSDATTDPVQIVKISDDNPEIYSCDNNSGFDALVGGTVYANPTWSTTGSKTVDLGTTADSDVESRLTAGDIFALTIKTNESVSNLGGIYSVNNGTPSNRPVLRVSYTLPPQTPTNFQSSSVSTSTIDWSWTDNATVETQYNVHDASHTPVAGCSALAANTQTCTETGLSTNTQYTRHVNVTDAHGNTDSATASAYTAIETPSGVSIGAYDEDSISVSADGTFSNLSSGLAGLYFEETTTPDSSGWVQTNSYGLLGLTPNTEYGFRVKARNGDAVETAFTAGTSVYTLSVVPDVDSVRSTSTWYGSGGFDFSNAAAWGSGGVEYYRYAWEQSSTHVFNGSESTWSDADAKCPGGTCTSAAETLTQTATDGDDWYLHVQSFNADDIANGSGTSYGPFYFDSTGPTPPATVRDGSGSDVDYQASTNTISANWPAASDAGSGVDAYEYAIGTTSGGTDVVGYTNVGATTSILRTGLSLTPNATYYVSVRSIDALGNTGAPQSSDGVTVTVEDETVETTISNVAVIENQTSATISWSTNEAATSKVDYGTTAAYGLSKSSNTLTTSHSLTLTGLSAGTSYHFRITSVGSTTAITADDTFATVAASSGTGRAIGPTLRLARVSNGSQPAVSFNGVAKGNQVIAVYLDGRHIKTIRTRGTSEQTKTFGLTVSTVGLDAGKHTLYAQSTDERGRTSVVRQKIRFVVGNEAVRTTFRVSAPSSYVVQPGDSLWKISQQFLGDPLRYGEIVSLNAEMFSTLPGQPHLIQPGWILELPRGV